MAVTRTDKESELHQLEGAFKGTETAIVLDYRGLNVPQVTELRRQVRAVRGKYRVVKNTLARRALQEAGVQGFESQFTGPTALALGYDDPTLPIKVLLEFARGKDKPKMKGALFEGSVVGAREVSQLAILPSRGVLLAQVCAGFLAPLSQFVGVLQGLLQTFVATLDAVGEQKKTRGPQLEAPQEATETAETSEPVQPEPETVSPAGPPPPAGPDGEEVPEGTWFKG